MPKVSLCLRNGLFCECLSASLRQSGVFTCQTITPQKILESLTAEHRDFCPADLILLDAGVATENIEMIFQATRRSLPNCKLVLLISEQTVPRMVELARLGSHGCLFEDIPLCDVLDAMRVVLSGKSFCSPQLANSLLAQLGTISHDEPWSQHLDRVQLTTREREVLDMISRERLCNKQIARRLCVSLYTVKNHVHNIIEKLGAQDRYDAADIAIRRKLLIGKRQATPIEVSS